MVQENPKSMMRRLSRSMMANRYMKPFVIQILMILIPQFVSHLMGALYLLERGYVWKNFRMFCFVGLTYHRRLGVLKGEENAYENEKKQNIYAGMPFDDDGSYLDRMWF